LAENRDFEPNLAKVFWFKKAISFSFSKNFETKKIVYDFMQINFDSLVQYQPTQITKLKVSWPYKYSSHFQQLT